MPSIPNSFHQLHRLATSVYYSCGSRPSWNVVFPHLRWNLETTKTKRRKNISDFEPNTLELSVLGAIPLVRRSSRCMYQRVTCLLCAWNSIKLAQINFEDKTINPTGSAFSQTMHIILAILPNQFELQYLPF